MQYTILFALVLTLFMRTDAELYSSVVALEDLLKTEERTIEDLERYINKEEDRLSTLESYLHNFQREHDRAMEDIPNNMSNPVNVYNLIKRLTTDVNYINNGIREISEGSGNYNITVEHEDVKYPTKEDLAGAARALILLQKTYNLDEEELAEGKLNGVVNSSPMTAIDCYELGRVLHAEGYYMNARTWFYHAFRKYYEENVTYPFTDIDILDNFNNTCYRYGKPKSAHEYSQKILDIHPGHERAKEILEFYQKRLNSWRYALRNKIFKKDIKKNVLTAKCSTDTYEPLCRGDLEVPIKLSSRFTCRYMSETHPFLKIAPFKIEMMYLEPDIILFHDIISDEEIEALKEMSIPKFHRSEVYHANHTTGVSMSRISQQAWWRDNQSELVARLSRRVSLMTGLSTVPESTDRLQVVNYGIGGHFEPHFDFFGPAQSIPDEEIKEQGDRIATTLFYMSNVAQGGATVFLELGVKVVPVKGTAVVWYNMLPSGSRDTATKHAACPVLSGSKWVFTKWIYQVGQELLRPCSLEYELVDHHTSKTLSPVAKSLNHAIKY